MQWFTERPGKSGSLKYFLNNTYRLESYLDFNTILTACAPSVCFVVFNSESTHHFVQNEEYRNFANECCGYFLDGSALQLVMNCKDASNKVKRYHGPDFLLDLIKKPPTGCDLVLVGGQELTVSQLDQLGFQRQINLPMHHSLDYLVEYFKNSVKHKSVEIERKQIYLVSLGLPKQELFISRLIAEKFPGVFIPIGAAVDFVTRHKKRSSVFWRRLGLEFLPRLIREPRMLKRNFRSFRGVVKYLFS
ncbi:WecB/TagA/CpsF family glycosyltransferase [Paracoccaceae bacterium]|nr:WecB/TagA/CpsF family glycosyltransferase [Paracoccaceae bacterium]